jgi:Domain of unknown function (DUF4082)/Bacterial Ig-like domain/Bacterial Ig domain
MNNIVTENAQIGNPASEWDLNGEDDSSIEGFATEISVNRGGTVRFKVNTDATNYRLDIYRLGYYSGMGARKVGTVLVTSPQQQPLCRVDVATGLIDCGNWAVSASWTVPATATSGIYLAKLVRPDTGGASHIVFIVRDDASTSDLLFQTSDTTWQAYNDYGQFKDINRPGQTFGNSFYVGFPGQSPSLSNPSRAYKVSYNRPLITRRTSPNNNLFIDTYPMVRWLEANGYDVSYSTGVDSDRRGDLIRNHKVFLSVGHDEYWSGAQRTNVEAARDAGKNLAFFSANEVYWKTRWENSIDGANTPYRTLVSYKESFANAVIDPLDPPTWTGLWRDPRFSPPGDGARPENALTGTFPMVVSDHHETIKVSDTDGKMRFWRNTDIATLPPGGIATLAPNTLGYEWDIDSDNGSRPAGLFHLSSTTVDVPSQVFRDYGTTNTIGATLTHNLTLYRASSRALIFGAGTINWQWGLDENHDNPENLGLGTDVRMKQATVNLFADMGVQPATLQSGLVPATASTDTTAPSSTITSPTAGTTVQTGSIVTISGSATDSGGGRVGGVEVSVDGGTTWHPADGRDSWSYTWAPVVSGTMTIKSRAVDDSGNLETPKIGVTVTVELRTCTQQPCSIWPPTATPRNSSERDPRPIEVGVKFRSDVDGFITGIRFYKGRSNTDMHYPGSGNPGPHIGTLWSSTGTQLAQATFSSETASGWQQVTFATPVAIMANTVYVASYHTASGGYAADNNFFATAGVDLTPLHALRNGESGENGVYRYSETPAFPTDFFQSTNYWVDVVFTTAPTGLDTTKPTVSSTTPSSGTTNFSISTPVKATFSEAMAPATISTSTFELRGPSNALVTATVSYDAASKTATLTPSSALAVSTTYTATIKGGTTDPRVKDLAGNALAANLSWSFTTGAASSTRSIWSPTATPTNPSFPDATAVELGVKFRSDVNGRITGIRFYKGSGNTGPHVGSLWNNTDRALLAQANFTNETASGWQQVTFATPVAITAGTIYVASYHTNVGRYAADNSFFATVGVDNVPLHALSNAAGGGNGVYRYSATPAFPDSTFQSTNYWVDLVFTTP